MKKFEKSDVFFNAIRANPKASFFTYDGKIYHANSVEQGENLGTQFLQFPPPPPIVVEITIPAAGGATYRIDQDFGITQPSADIYLVDASATGAGNTYFFIDWDPSLYTGTQVTFTRTDTNAPPTLLQLYVEYGSPGPSYENYLFSVGSSFTFVSNGVFWEQQ